MGRSLSTVNLPAKVARWQGGRTSFWCSDSQFRSDSTVILGYHILECTSMSLLHTSFGLTILLTCPLNAPFSYCFSHVALGNSALISGQPRPGP